MLTCTHIRDPERRMLPRAGIEHSMTSKSATRLVLGAPSPAPWTKKIGFAKGWPFGGLEGADPLIYRAVFSASNDASSHSRAVGITTSRPFPATLFTPAQKKPAPLSAAISGQGGTRLPYKYLLPQPACAHIRHQLTMSARAGRSCQDQASVPCRSD